MSKFKVEVIRDRAKKCANVYVQFNEDSGEDGSERYLTSDGPAKRLMGEEMPVWAVIPDEIFDPMVKAAADGGRFR